MIDPSNVPEVDSDEVVARYVVAGKSTKSLRKLVRADQTVKPQLFLPYSKVRVSVNRNRDCAEQEIWDFGRQVARQRGLEFHGRADIRVADCGIGPLKVVPEPIIDDPDGAPDNPNHADIVGFPATKEDQMSLAEKLAANASGCHLPSE